MNLKIIRNEVRTAYFISVKYFKRNYKILSFLTIILSFCFVNIVFFSAVNKGLTETLNNQVRSYTVGDIIIEPREGRLLISGVENIVKNVETIPGIVAVAPRYDHMVAIRKDDKSSGNRLIAIDPEREYGVSSLESALIDGKSIGRYEEDALMLGIEIADSTATRTMTRGYGIDAGVGDSVEVEFDRNHKRNYTVKGIFDTRFWESDIYIVANQKDVLPMLGLKDQASYILIKTDDVSKAPYYKREILKLGLDAKISLWEEKAGFVQDIAGSLNIIQILMFGAGIMIASITIFITMLINIFNRMRFIGILRAIGVNRSTIILSYLMQTFFYCAAGIIIGLLMTNVLANYFMYKPLDLPMGLVSLTFTSRDLAIAAVSIVIASLVSVLIPSYQITKKNIIYAIFRGGK